MKASKNNIQLTRIAIEPLIITIIISVILFSSCVVYSQYDFKIPESREVVINTLDSSIRVNIHTKKYTGKIKNSTTYYWYYANEIHNNVGGFSGSMLHGQYQVFSKDNQLLVKGGFSEGVKDGEWKRWYDNGNLKEVTHWRSGKLDGICTYYSIDGALESSKKYKNGEFLEDILDLDIEQMEVEEDEEKGKFFTRAITWIKNIFKKQDE